MSTRSSWENYSFSAPGVASPNTGHPNDINSKSAYRIPVVLLCSYGKVESIRLRSLPVNLQSKLSRRASAITRDLTETRAPAHAYVVFTTAEAASAALQHNMAEVRPGKLRVCRLNSRINPSKHPQRCSTPQHGRGCEPGDSGLALGRL